MSRSASPRYPPFGPSSGHGSFAGGQTGHSNAKQPSSERLKDKSSFAPSKSIWGTLSQGSSEADSMKSTHPSGGSSPSRGTGLGTSSYPISSILRNPWGQVNHHRTPSESPNPLFSTQRPSKLDDADSSGWSRSGSLSGTGVLSPGQISDFHNGYASQTHSALSQEVDLYGIRSTSFPSPFTSRSTNHWQNGFENENAFRTSACRLSCGGNPDMRDETRFGRHGPSVCSDIRAPGTGFLYSCYSPSSNKSRLERTGPDTGTAQFSAQLSRDVAEPLQSVPCHISDLTANMDYLGLDRGQMQDARGRNLLNSSSTNRGDDRRISNLSGPGGRALSSNNVSGFRAAEHFAESWTLAGLREGSTTDRHENPIFCKPEGPSSKLKRPGIRSPNIEPNTHKRADEACGSHSQPGDSCFGRPAMSIAGFEHDEATISQPYLGYSTQNPRQPLESVPCSLRAYQFPQVAYNFPKDAQMNGVPVYIQMPNGQPVMISSLGASRPSEPLSSRSCRSALLEEFKSNTKGGWRYELRDIYDHVVEFSGDQNGSRFIQDKLISATSDEKNRVFNEILPNALQLMMDVFGNYVIQRFFERGDQTQKGILVSRMRGQMLTLSNHVYGCRVVQSALQFVLVEQQVALVRELEPESSVLKCVKDQNGNHVIQAAIEHVPVEHIQFIINVFIGQVHHLATHAYGCRVVQRLLTYWSEPGRSVILREVHECAHVLISDQYGNYVIQYLLDNEVLEDRLKIINVVRSNLVSYAKQKFASNVVERCFVRATEEQRRDMMYQISAKDEHGETPLASMVKDAYGNYVIQKLLETLGDTNYATFVSILAPEIAKAKRFMGSKQADNVAKKMHRLDRALEHDRMYSSQLGPQSQTQNDRALPALTKALATSSSTIDGPRTAFHGPYSSNGIKFAPNSELRSFF